jgi:hypothetical protein
MLRAQPKARISRVSTKYDEVMPAPDERECEEKQEAERDTLAHGYNLIQTGYYLGAPVEPFDREYRGPGQADHDKSENLLDVELGLAPEQTRAEPQPISQIESEAEAANIEKPEKGPLGQQTSLACPRGGCRHHALLADFSLACDFHLVYLLEYLRQ